MTKTNTLIPNLFSFLSKPQPFLAINVKNTKKKKNKDGCPVPRVRHRH